MRTFYQLCPFLIFLFSLTSCFGPSEKENNDFYNVDNNENEYVNDIRNDDIPVENLQSKKAIKYFQSIDQSTGMVSSSYPFPSNWKKSEQPGYLYEGPNNIRISSYTSNSFQFTNNQEMAYMWQQQGVQNVPPMAVEQIVEQYFMPIARETGRTLSKSYPLPELARSLTIFHSLLFVSVPTQRDIKAYGLEWVDGNSMSYSSALTITISYSQLSSSWTLGNQYLEAPNAHFEKAKEAFLYGITNFDLNPQWLQVCNQRDAKKAGIMYQEHLGRMAAINARTSSSKSVSDIYSEISDINHAGYLKRSDINSASHAKVINAIGERSVIGNHNTGEHYNVQSGSKYYWVNNDGKYFGTNNSLLDPRIDNRLNNTQWTLFQEEH